MNSPGAPSDQSTARKTVRRLGPAGAPTWHAILDGAETILREEGYAALNARRIAQRAGIKRQLVYYYFCDNDDLFVQLFHRIANRELERLKSALESDNPLRQTWHAGIYTLDARLIAEFTALASRNEQVRKVVVEYIQTAREVQVAALAKALMDRPLPKVEIPLIGLAFLAANAALGLQREAEIGFTKGHQEIQQVIQAFLSGAESSEVDSAGQD